MSRLILMHSVAEDEYGEPLETRVVELGAGMTVNSAIMEIERPSYLFGYLSKRYRANKDFSIYYVAEVERTNSRDIIYPFYPYVHLENAKKKYDELNEKGLRDVYLFKAIYDGKEESDVPIDEAYMKKNSVV